jgi:hypothetical protein
MKFPPYVFESILLPIIVVSQISHVLTYYPSSVIVLLIDTVVRLFHDVMGEKSFLVNCHICTVQKKKKKKKTRIMPLKFADGGKRFENLGGKRR